MALSLGGKWSFNPKYWLRKRKIPSNKFIGNDKTYVGHFNWRIGLISAERKNRKIIFSLTI